MLFPWNKPRSDKIFINYRRDDTSGFAGRLSDTLASYFGCNRVFRDVTGIDYGHDFSQVIDQKLEESGAVVVLISEKWSAITDKDDKRRLNDPADYVSREIAAALKSNVPVIPVLIDDATMPRADELPETLGELTRRNAMTLTDERWDFDVTRLAKVLAIDVPGSVVQRKLSLLQSLALLLLFASGALATVVVCKAVYKWVQAGNETLLKDAGFSSLESAFPFIAILLAGTLALVAAPMIEASKRKFAWAATSLAYVGTLGTFIYYTISNAAMPSLSLVVNYGASMIIIVGVLALMSLTAFRAK